MPEKGSYDRIVATSISDLRKVRMPGLDKPFEELTISELVQLRPGSEVADSYNVNAVTDNISVSSSSLLEELGNIQKERVISKVVDQQRLDGLRAKFQAGANVRIGQLSADGPGPDEVRLPEEFSGDVSPFDA